MMKTIALCALFFAVLTTNAFGCFCVTAGENAEPVPTGEIVFQRRVVATELIIVGDDGDMFLPVTTDKTAHPYIVTVFEVSELFRGDVPPFVIIVTTAGHCGYVFKRGESYLVEGSWTTDKTLTKLAGSSRAMTTSLCTLTAPAERARGILERLRKSHAPASPLFVR